MTWATVTFKKPINLHSLLLKKPIKCPILELLVLVFDVCMYIQAVCVLMVLQK